jgi:hypothetical protein
VIELSWVAKIALSSAKVHIVFSFVLLFWVDHVCREYITAGLVNFLGAPLNGLVGGWIFPHLF